MYLRLLQQACSVHCKPYGQDFGVVPGDFVFADGGLGSVATVFGGGGGRKMPFHVGGAADKGDVVEVVDLEV